jgi:hypothetical protein
LALKFEAVYLRKIMSDEPQYPEHSHPEGTTFMYEVYCARNGLRHWTTEWTIAMTYMRKLHELGLRCRVFRAPLAIEATPERTAQLMNAVLRAQKFNQAPPLFANSVVMASDFDDEGQYAVVNPFKDVDAEIEEP